MADLKVRITQVSFGSTPGPAAEVGRSSWLPGGTRGGVANTQDISRCALSLLNSLAFPEPRAGDRDEVAAPSRRRARAAVNGSETSIDHSVGGSSRSRAAAGRA